MPGPLWEGIIERLHFALQPIVNVHTGAAYGYEALLRGWESAGFQSIHDLFDAAHEELLLHQLDIRLRIKAIETFVQLPHHREARLFFNLDHRVTDMPDYRPGVTSEILEKHGLMTDSLCLEVSERHDVASSDRSLRTLRHYRQQLFRIAVDDYGAGFSGLRLLYQSEPDFVKIDRFFIEGIASDPKKKLFVSNVVNLAHTLGALVIGEGVETEEELRVCREVGCDLVQGYFIQHPVTALVDVQQVYEHVAESARNDRRASKTSMKDARIARIEQPRPVRAEMGMQEVLRTLREDARATFVIVVDKHDAPLGIVRQSTISPFVYSQFGWALLAGRHEPVAEYLSHCPVANVHAPVDRLMEMFSVAADSAEGVILVEHGRYVGFISAGELLKAVNERDLEAARDCNPLTRLPGNTTIGHAVREALADTTSGQLFAHFDFDDFKPFNDAYGFRRGDRAIQMFADCLRQVAMDIEAFVGHIGGDDFFFVSSTRGLDHGAIIGVLRGVIGKLRRDVQSLYSREDRERGYILGTDRSGRPRSYPLMGVSLAVLYRPAGDETLMPSTVSRLMASLKHAAKQSPSRFAFRTHGDGPEVPFATYHDFASSRLGDAAELI